jgi:hypothetical protein
MQVANVHDVFMTEQALTIGIKTIGQVDEKAIHAILRKTQADLPVDLPKEDAGSPPPGIR